MMSSSSIVVFLAAMTVVTSLPVATSRENRNQVVARALRSTAISLKRMKHQTDDTFKLFIATHTNFIPENDSDMDTHEKYAEDMKTEGKHDRFLPDDFEFLINLSRSYEENIGDLYQTLNTFAEEYRIAVVKIRRIECKETLSVEACPPQCNSKDRKHDMLCKLDALYQITRELDNNVKKMMQELNITRLWPETSVPVDVTGIYRMEYYLRVVYELKNTTARLNNAMDIVQQLRT